jgi:hypothetical protein
MLQYYCAGVAQLVEQLFCKQQVVGSSPTTGSKEEGIRKPSTVAVEGFCLASFGFM